MDEIQRHGAVGTAGLRAGLSPNTARKYVRAGRLPSELTGPRTWRTRVDPFEADWTELRARLVETPAALRALGAGSGSLRSPQ